MWGDLSTQVGVLKTAAQAAASAPVLHVLVHNAGVGSPGAIGEHSRERAVMAGAAANRLVASAPFAAAGYPTAATRSADSSHALARCAVLSSAKRVATRTTSAPNVRSCSSTLSSVSWPAESKTRYAEATGTT